MPRLLPEALIVEPFLHVGPGQIDNPITGRTLTHADAGYAVLQALLAQTQARASEARSTDPALLERLVAEGWLIARGSYGAREHAQGHDHGHDRDLARRFRLRVVSIETHTVCNQACVFCPVSIAPREAQSMDDALFARIVHQLASFRDTIEAIFLSSYNEPTLDPRLVEHCELLMRTGLPVALNTNATGLTPARVDRLAALGVLRLLSVNLSTLDRDRYKSDRGHDHLDLVLRNLDYAAQRLVATDMVIAVLGDEDDAHARTVDAVRNRFAGTRFQVRGHAVMDRAGRLPIGLKPEPAPDGRGPQRLAGCENLGSRPLQHLHITPAGRCVFCCEDYDERYIVGDLETMTLRQVLESDAMAQLRRWSYGLDEAPDDFICRKCIFALRR